MQHVQSNAHCERKPISISEMLQNWLGTHWQSKTWVTAKAASILVLHSFCRYPAADGNENPSWGCSHQIVNPRVSVQTHNLDSAGLVEVLSDHAHRPSCIDSQSQMALHFLGGFTSNETEQTWVWLSGKLTEFNLWKFNIRWRQRSMKWCCYKKMSYSRLSLIGTRGTRKICSI